MLEGLPCTGRQGTPDPLRGPILAVWHLATVADVEIATNSLYPIRAEPCWLTTGAALQGFGSRISGMACSCSDAVHAFTCRWCRFAMAARDGRLLEAQLLGHARQSASAYSANPPPAPPRWSLAPEANSHVM